MGNHGCAFVGSLPFYKSVVAEWGIMVAHLLELCLSKRCVSCAQMTKSEGILVYCLLPIALFGCIRRPGCIRQPGCIRPPNAFGRRKHLGPGPALAPKMLGPGPGPGAVIFWGRGRARAQMHSAAECIRRPNASRPPNAIGNRLSNRLSNRLI